MDSRGIVLVVDDNDEIREVLSDLLRDEGYHVLSAPNGQEAIQLLHRADRPDLILLDLMMPVMDGREFLVRQRQDPQLASIPVVVLSADGKVDEKAAALHASDWLKKPFLFDTLLETVGRHCSHATASPA